VFGEEGAVGVPVGVHDRNLDVISEREDPRAAVTDSSRKIDSGAELAVFRALVRAGMGEISTSANCVKLRSRDSVVK